MKCGFAWMRSSVFFASILVARLAFAEDEPDALARYKAEHFFEAGVDNLRANNLTEAEQSFRRAWQLVPDVQNLAGVAAALLAQAGSDAAVKVVQSEAAKRPDEPEFHLLLGDTAVQAGNYPLALTEFEKTLPTLDNNQQARIFVHRLTFSGPREGATPVSNAIASLVARDDTPKGSTGVYLRIAEVQLMKKDVAASLITFQKIKELRPGDALLAVYLASLLDTTGNKNEARLEYLAALKVAPNNPGALNNLAFLLVDTGGDNEEALKYALRARTIMPANPDIADTLGWIYLKKGSVSESIPLLCEAVRRQPDNTLHRAHLLVALDRSGRHSPALSDLRAALKTDAQPVTPKRLNELMLAVLRESGK
jgi:Flp pilus assembly protein TadD